MTWLFHALAAQATAERVLRRLRGALAWALFFAIVSASHFACFLLGRVTSG